MSCRLHFKTKHVDCYKFSEISKIHIGNLKINISNIQKTYDQLEGYIKEAIISAGAQNITHKSKWRRPSTIWWDDDCTQIIQLRKRLYKNFLEHPNADNL